MKRVALALIFLTASSAAAQTPGPFSPTGSTPPNTLFFNQLNAAFGGKQDFPGAIFSTSAIGHVPASPGGTGSFLRADGTWAPPLTTTINSTPIASGVTGRPLFDNGGVFGEYTAAQLTAYLNIFTPGLQGLVPASGGGGAGFLRADGIWIAPPAPSSFPFSSLTGNIAIGQMNGGTGASTSAFWRGDGTWAVPTVGAVSLIPGTSTITGGTSGRVLFDSAGLLGETANVAFLTTADQTISGGANVTQQGLTTGNVTIDCGARPLQSITNGGAFTITAPANDGSCMLLVTNNASAGAIAFSGFSVGASTGDALTTTNTSKFTLSIWRINGTSGYRVAAHQ